MPRGSELGPADRMSRMGGLEKAPGPDTEALRPDTESGGRAPGPDTGPDTKNERAPGLDTDSAGPRHRERPDTESAGRGHRECRASTQRAPGPDTEST